MEKSEQCVAIKLLWMKELRARCIPTKLSRVVSDDCYSPVAIERWLACFREGDLSCANHSRSGRPVIDISECLRDFLDKFPFASTSIMFKHFRIACGTILKTVQRDFGLKQFSRRWVPHQLSSPQKVDCVNRCRALLHLLQQLQLFDFEGMTTGDESWFRYEYESDSMFVPSVDMVFPRLGVGFQVKKTIITFFLTATRLTVLHSLPQNHSFTQDNFVFYSSLCVKIRTIDDFLEPKPNFHF
jgi:hypothetical protein